MAPVLPAALLAQDHPRIGLIFVGASWCPVCHAAASILAPAAEQSGLDILVASQDGKAIAPWTSFVDARGNPLTAKVKSIPTLLFVDLAQGTVISQFEGFPGAPQYLGMIRNTLRSAVEAGHG
jgi:thiol-disulfide isomerase/thioredoxin